MDAERRATHRLGCEIEIHTPDLPLGKGRYALFDFDGTLSLIRAGWQEVMLAQFTRTLAALGTGETPDELRAVCLDFVTRLTGKQTIYQMLELVAQIQRRGGRPRPALEYKREYLESLHARIGHRLAALRQRRVPPERYRVRGSASLLSGLQQRGVELYLASGTDQPFVEEEVELLGLAPFFAGRVYGAQDDYQSFSKKMVIERILTANHLSGPELLVFGDGYVEIENAKAAGGIAIGAATMEDGSGGWDAWKRRRLLEVGADILVPHWGEAPLLLRYLFGEEPRRGCG